MRDPLKDPGAFDVVRKKTKRGTTERSVVYVTLWGTVVYDSAAGKQRECSLDTWRRWAKGASVVASREIEPQKFEVHLALGHTEFQMLTLVGNRFNRYVRGRDKDDARSTPMTEPTLVALARYGLHKVLTDHASETEFFDGAYEHDVMENRQGSQDGPGRRPVSEIEIPKQLWGHA